MHRISERLEIKDWHFISGALNVSDHFTRPLTFEDLSKPNSLLNGPKILSEPLYSVSSKDDIALEEDEVVHSNLEITSNPVIVQKQ